MSWLRILSQRAVWRTRLRCSFGVCRPIHHRHKLLASIEDNRCLTVYSIRYPNHYSTVQCHAYGLRHTTKICAAEHQCVHEFSSSRSPLLFTDDLLQNYIKQIVTEWNQIQKQLTSNESDSGHLSAQRLHFLEPIVSKVQQHEQFSGDISELEDIISGMCIFHCSLCDYFFFTQNQPTLK